MTEHDGFAEHPDERPAPQDQRRRFLLLTHRRRTFGISLQAIQHITEFEHLSPVPLAPAYVIGAMSHAGSIVMVLDLGRLLDLPEVRTEERGVILILGLAGVNVGLLAEGVHDLVEVPESTITPVTGPEERSGFFLGSTEYAGLIVDLLDERRIADMLLPAETRSRASTA